MKIAQISDIHIDYSATRLGVSHIVNGVNTIHKERMDRLASIICECTRLNVEAIVLSGDIHNKSRPVAQEYGDLYDILDSIPSHITVYVIPGNHDESTSRGSPLLPLLNRRKNIHVFFELTNVGIQMWRFIFAPWGTPFDQIEQAANTHSPKVLIYHVGVTGTDGMNWGEINDETGTIHIDKLKSLGCEGIMLGHHHNQVELAKNIWYAGSPECFNFGEKDQTKGFLIWEFDQKREGFTTKVTPMETKYPKFIDISHMELKYSKPEDFEDKYVRINGDITAEERIEIIKKVSQLKNCPGVKYNLKMITKKNTLVPIPGKTPGAILLNFLKRGTSYTEAQLQLFLEIDARIEKEIE